MTPYRKRVANAILSGIMLFSMLFSLVSPAMQFTVAQEVTEEADSPIQQPTQIPEATTEVTESPTESAPVEITPQPTIEVTAEPTAAATLEITEEPTSQATDEATAIPTTPPAPVDSFQDDFQDGEAGNWILSTGWQLITEDDNTFLSTSTPAEQATIADVDWPHLLLAAQFRIESEATGIIEIRSSSESYRIELASDGKANLYRGVVLLAEGSPASDETETGWRQINLQALGGMITVVVDGALQFSYIDPAPLGAGPISFSTAQDSLGIVTFDNISITRLDEPVPLPTLTSTPETTVEPTAEFIEEATAEVTEEATAEPTPTGPLPILTADFESGLIGWAISEDASIVPAGESNSALLLTGEGALTPKEVLYLADFRTEARFQLIENGLNFAFRVQEAHYVLSIDTAQITLARIDDVESYLLTSTEVTLENNIWYSMGVEARGDQIQVSLDGGPVLVYEDADPLLNGQIAFSTSGQIMLDNVVVIDFTPEGQAVLPTPLGLTEADQDKLTNLLYEVVTLYLSGEETAALELAESYFIIIDNTQRADVIVRAAEEISGETLIPLVETVGGVVDFTADRYVAARIPLDGIPALIQNSDVLFIGLPDRATSTDDLLAPLQAGSGGVIPHSLDHIGVTDWYDANIRGNGVTIGVIDTSFTGVNTGNANYACFSGTPGDGSGSGHGARVVQVICDIAPNSTVRGYIAQNSNQLITRINTARADNNRIILIPLDMGVHLGPGDGTDGNSTYNSGNPSSVYDAIRAAREAGILVITSAGNNNDNAYVSWTYSAAVSFTIVGSPGDTVSLSWNDWPIAPNNGGAAENFQLAVSGGASASRSPGADPGVQVTLTGSGPYTVTVSRLGGNSSSDYLQLQTTGRITGNTGGLTPNTTSTMGRPGDATHALSIGAVCSSQNERYPILSESSRGPLYTIGGNPPPTVPGNDSITVKPDLVSLSHVSIVGSPVTTPCATLGTDGFNGTSAAAAHVTGMAALLISNPNASMNPFDGGAGAANALQNYLQSYTIGLTSTSSADGFDNTYGAGVAVLGSPTYDLTQISKPGGVNGLPGTTYYVGGHAISATNNPSQDGSLTNPFTSLTRAIDAATTGDSIVLFPGEFISGVEIPKSVGIYAYNRFGNGADSVFRTNNSFQGNAGLFVTAEDVIIDGFDFRPSNPQGLSDCCGEVFPRATAVEFRNVNSGILRNSTFEEYDTATPVSVVNSPGVQITNNIFNEINGGSLFAAALRILDSESANSANPVRVEYNEFTGNFTQRLSFDTDLEAIVNVQESAVDFVGNFFYNNNSETVVRIRNTDDPGAASDGAVGTSMVNFYSNIFANNQRGPIVYARIGRRLRFINNTVVNNTGNNGISGNPHLGLIQRDNPRSDGTNWTHVSSDVNGNWDVHNNIFYDNFNGASSLKIVDEGGGNDDTLNSFCVSLGSGTNTGMSNNWIFDSGVVNAGTGAGDCAGAMVDGGGSALNNHILNTDLQNQFVSAVPPYPSDSNGYRLKDTAPGINTANASVPNSTHDFTGINPRIVDTGPDIGAFELTPIEATPITMNRLEDTFNQLGDQTGAFAINLAEYVIGGFEPYIFSINTYPANYSTSASDPCGGLGVIIQGTRALYCPPQHFYNQGTTYGADDDVVFEYRVTDAFGGIAIADVTVNISPVNDEQLTAGSSFTYNFVAEGNQPFSLRLRPFVRFSNFRFSEAGDATRGNQADYPFSYAYVDLDTTEPGYNPNLFGVDESASEAHLTSQIAAAGPDGLITLTPQLGELGFLTFSYTVTDSRGGTVTNKIRLEVAGLLPDNGLHDDSSLNFTYSNGWSPIYSEGNINNTLHTTNSSNATARFEFVAETFTLYMQSDRRGGDWQLKIDGSAPLQWTTNNGESTATSGGATCSTRATTNGNRISNNDRTLIMYTVTCRNLSADEQHTMEIVTVTNNRFVLIDAISLNSDEAPLRTGFHEVNELDVLPYFPGWTLFNDAKASNRVALRTNTPGEVQFSFTGTGIAIGTGLEGAGANYTICVKPEGGIEVCQSFNNRDGAPRRGVTYGVFRPFFGYDPEGEHTVRLIINSIPNGGRMVIDSITVFNQQPTAPLRFGTTEDDEIGPIVYGNGVDDSWTFNTNNRKASNRSLHSIIKRVNNIGPFISFDIPANANRVLWYRSGSRQDSTQILVCVDRAQGEVANNHCKTVNLRTIGNLYAIQESDFPGGWGTGFGDNDTHTIEIFSLANAAFNMDKVQVFDTNAPLSPSFYEEFNLDGNNNVYGYFRSDAQGNALGGQDFSNIANNTTRKASGGAVKRTTASGAGVFFQMTGTGFSVGFTRDRSAGNAQICWVTGHTNNIANIRAGTCRTYNNNDRPFYQMEHAVVGLSETPADYSVIVRNVNGRMDFDTLTIHDALPNESLDSHGFRYETNYDRRDMDKLFMYYGNGWRTRAVARASGGSTDEINKKIGAGIVFKTNGVDTVEIIRTPHKRNAATQVCVDGANCRNFAGDANPIVVNLGNTAPHRVSVTTITEGKFVLDAVDVYDSSNPITTGFYEDNYPLLKFDNSWSSNANRTFSAGRARRTTVNNGTLLFHMNGDSFLIGTQISQADQIQICYVSGIEANANNVSSNCQTWPSSATGGIQDYSLNLGSPGNYTVRVRNTAAVALSIDYVYIVNSTDPLAPGYYEEAYPVLTAGRQGSGWNIINNKNYSGGSAVQTSTAGDRLLFEFEGTGFAVGTFMGRSGGNMVVCYEAGALSSFTGDGSDIDANCYTYNNNLNRNSYNISRTVSGLADGTYSVRVQNASAQLQVDYVEIFNNTPVVLATPGVYNENGTLSIDEPYLSLLPTNRWAQVSGKQARNYSGGSYQTILDTRGRASNAYAGPVATLRVQVPPDPDGAGSLLGRATVILDTGPVAKRNSTQLLICTNNVSTASCQIRNMAQNQYHSITLTNNTGAPVTRVITYRAITPGSFNIDGFQLITDFTLQEGIYDDFLMSDNGIIDLDGTWQLPPARGTKNRRAFGGTQIGTNANNASLTFDFTGTGFAIFTQQSNRGINFQLCYVPRAEFTTWNASGVTCSNRTTSIARGKVDRYGHTVYGLSPDTYKVRLRVNDNSIDTRRDNLYVDAVAIFGDVSGATALQPGMYDNVDLANNHADAVRFSPVPFWDMNTTKLGPPRGPWNSSQHLTSAVGALMQIYMEGNALVIYQKADRKSSSWVQACLVIPGTDEGERLCTNFSQNSRKATYFTPIVIYGLGAGTHEVILENRDTRQFNVDALQIIP